MSVDDLDPKTELKRLGGIISRFDDRLAAVEAALEEERRAREALEERLAVLDRGGRRPASFEPARPEPSTTARDDDPDRLKSVLADWGFGARTRQKAATETPAAPAKSPAPGPAPAKAPVASVVAPKLPTPKVPETRAPAPAATPPKVSAPKPVAPKPAAPKPPFDSSVPTVLDALERDATLTEGQRDILRMTYRRFWSDAMPNPKAVLPEGATVGDVLKTDPNLQYGQREALLTMYNSFGANRRKKP
jgi:hypothetical protein